MPQLALHPANKVALCDHARKRKRIDQVNSFSTCSTIPIDGAILLTMCVIDGGHDSVAEEDGQVLLEGLSTHPIGIVIKAMAEI